MGGRSPRPHPDRPAREGPHCGCTRGRLGPILNGIPTQLPDIDPEETAGVARVARRRHRRPGRTRARYIMLKLLERAREMQVGVPSLTATDYVNTIGPEAEPWFPGDEEVERRYRAYLRWNAAIMVHRAQRPGVSVGGHISTYASAATLYEVGLQPLLPRQGPPRRRRPGLLPGPRLPRHVRPRLPRGPADGGPARRLPPGEVPRRRRAASARCRRTRTRASCRTSGSSRPCRWASAR